MGSLWPITKKPANDTEAADQPDLLGLRDRALIGIMVYSFARTGAVIQSLHPIPCSSGTLPHHPPAGESAAGGCVYTKAGHGLPVGRVGEPEDLAETYLYLMRERLSTGAMVVIDGGSTLL